MANENNTSFELDTGKLLATLHLAAAQAVPNSIAINTGIVNPPAKPDPNNPGNTEFDSDNKTGEYQIGIIKPISYKVQIDITKNKALAIAYEKFKKAEEADKNKQSNESYSFPSFLNYLIEDIKEEGTDKGLLDKEDKSIDKDEKNNEQIDVIIEGTESYKTAEEIIKIYDEYISGCDKTNFKNATKKYTELSKAIKDSQKDKVDNKKAISNFKNLNKLFKDAIEEENKDRIEYKKQNIEEIRKECLEDLKTYVTIYSGKENASKIRETECVLFDVDIDGNIKDASQFKNIKDFKVDTKDLEKDINKMEENQQKTDQNEWITRNIGYLIGFNLNFEG